ncbi:CST complex subunit Ten1 [Xylaria intraflava]|nr:CST complex subunit Ten1 [Xylaria intraflava]
MSNGPLPSDRCLLSTLCNKKIGDKVRFLGCVTGYSTRSAQVILKHGYPKENGDVEAIVDVKLLLRTLKSEQTDIGQWVHVIGYLTSIRPAAATDAPDSLGRRVTPRVGVQALILWTAQDLDLGAYEKSMLADTDPSTVDLARKRSNGK